MKHFIKLTILFLSQNLVAQTTKTDFALVNIGFGGISAGIGAVINKKPNEKTGKVFLKGLWQGALGGSFNHASKIIVGENNINDIETSTYFWPAKITSSIGNSILENAASNRNFYEQFNFHFGFNRLEIHFQKKMELKYKVMPIQFFYDAYLFATTKFDLKNSLKIGEMVYRSENIDSKYNGATIGTSIVFNAKFELQNGTTSHEVIHVIQRNNFMVFNNYFNPLINKWTSKSKQFSKINNWIYWDTHIIFNGIVGAAINKDLNRYYENFFEKEAAFYTKTFKDLR